MGLTGGMIALSSGANALSDGLGAYSQSKAIKQQGKYQAQQLQFNSDVADLQAEDAIRRGNKAVSARKRQTKQDIGSIRAKMAASGVEVNEDSALLAQEDAAMVGAEDIETIKNDAWREAWGYKVQASDYANQSKMAITSSKFNANETLLTGGLNFAKSVASGGTTYYKGKKLGYFDKK